MTTKELNLIVLGRVGKWSVTYIGLMHCAILCIKPPSQAEGDDRSCLIAGKTQ